METELASNLAKLVDRYGASRGLTASTIGKMCASDGRFFSRLREGKTFTVRNYDDLIQWFSDNWPSDAQWPEEVGRPLEPMSREAAE